MCRCKYYDKESENCSKLLNIGAGSPPISLRYICDPDICEDFEYDYCPTIEELEKEYKEWAIDLLKVRFDLKPEYYDPHQHNNFTYENCADCLWNKVKNGIEELLYLKRYNK